MQIVAAIVSILLLLTGPAAADGLSVWLEQLRLHGATPIRANAEADRVRAQVLDAQTAYLPEAKISYGAGWKQDSTLPTPGLDKQQQYRASIEQTIFDWGVGLRRIDAARARTTGAESKALGDISAFLGDAADTYIRAWRADEVIGTKQRALRDLQAILVRVKARHEARGSSALDVARVNAAVLSTKAELSGLVADGVSAKAGFLRFASEPPKITKPKLPQTMPADTQSAVRMALTAPSIRETEQRIAAIKSIELASERSRFGTIKASADYQLKKGDTYSDASIFARYEVPLYDKGRTRAEDYANAADLRAAYGALGELKHNAIARVTDAMGRLSSARSIQAFASERVKAAKARRDLNVIALDDKPGSVGDLISAILDLNQAEIAVIGAEADRIAAAYRVLQFSDLL